MPEWNKKEHNFDIFLNAGGHQNKTGENSFSDSKTGKNTFYEVIFEALYKSLFLYVIRQRSMDLKHLFPGIQNT